MARIEGFRVRNYRALRDITLGKLWNTPKVDRLTPMTAVIGKNGVGKSALFDAFGFLADCLKLGVEEACDARGRGGFERLRSLGSRGPMAFDVYYRESSHARPIAYEVAIGQEASGRPYVISERLRQRRQGQSTGWPFSFLILQNGRGLVWKGEERGRRITDSNPDELDLESLIEEEGENPEKEDIELEDHRRLGVATLGILKQHPRISAFRQFIEGWYLSYFMPDAARSLPLRRAATTFECSRR